MLRITIKYIPLAISFKCPFSENTILLLANEVWPIMSLYSVIRTG